MRVLLIGAKGLLGQALVNVFAAEDLTAIDRDELDITDESAVQKFCREVGPEAIINAAAHNAVDEIERNAKATRQAFMTNAEAVGYLTKAAIEHNSLLVHFSTDYVFDGSKGSPYVEDDQPRPISAYGRSKYEGEQAIIKHGNRGLGYYLIRTSRLFGKSAGGKKTFVDIVLDLAGENYELQFIDDEIASPTYVYDLAAAVKEMLASRPAFGIYHRANDGYCSWYEFAKTILNESDAYSTNQTASNRKYMKPLRPLGHGLLTIAQPRTKAPSSMDFAPSRPAMAEGAFGAWVNLRPISGQDMPRPARRPAYSVLKSTKLPPLRSWREALRDYMTTNHL